MPRARVLGVSPREHLLYLGLGLAVGLAVAPAVLLPGPAILGSRYVGAYSHIWKYWWTAHALLSLHNPAWTDLLAYPQPYPVGYYLASFGNALIGLPITLLLGPERSFDAVVVLNSAFGTWATALLARRGGVGRLSAALAGLAWAYCPHHLGFFMGGATEYAAEPWTPLALLALLELLDSRLVDARPDRSPTRLALLLGLSLVMAGLVAWFKGLLALGWTGVLGLGLLVSRRSWRRRETLLALAAYLAAGLLLALAAHLTLPLPPAPPGDAPAPPAKIMPIGRSMFFATERRFDSEELLFASSSLWINHHLLWSLVVLALLGLARPRGRFWAALLLPFVLEVFLIDAFGVSLHLLSSLLPNSLYTLGTFFNDAMRRLAPAHLFLALAAAHGLDHAARWARRHLPPLPARLLPPLAVGLWAAELALLGPVHLPLSSFRADRPAYLAELAEEGPGAVLDIPLFLERSQYDAAVAKAGRSRYLYYQTYHHHPIFSFVGSRIVYEPRALPIRVPRLVSLEEECLDGAEAKRRIPEGWRPRSLLRAGYRWIVLHPLFLGSHCYQRWREELEQALGAPRRYLDGTLIFELEQEAPRPHPRH